MDYPFFKATSGVVYLFLLSTFIYLAFVSSGTYAAPFQSYNDDEDVESLFEGDVNSLCASAGISTATRVLCRLIELQTEQEQHEFLPLNHWRNQRVYKRESSAFSSFQRAVNEIIRKSKENEHYRRQYQRFLNMGLITSEGKVIQLPQSESDSHLKNAMTSVG